MRLTARSSVSNGALRKPSRTPQRVTLYDHRQTCIDGREVDSLDRRHASVGYVGSRAW